MKILKFFLFTVAILTVAACSSDDDGVSTPVVELSNANLAGTYELNYLKGSSETTVTNGEVTVGFSSEEWEGDTFTNTFIVFNADGTYTSSGNYRETYTETIAGQSETDMEIVPVTDSGTYTVNTDSRTITFNGNAIWDVTLFNNSELRIVENFTEIDGSFTGTGTEERRMAKVE